MHWLSISVSHHRNPLHIERVMVKPSLTEIFYGHQANARRMPYVRLKCMSVSSKVAGADGSADVIVVCVNESKCGFRRTSICCLSCGTHYDPPLLVRWKWISWVLSVVVPYVSLIIVVSCKVVEQDSSNIAII